MTEVNTATLTLENAMGPTPATENVEHAVALARLELGMKHLETTMSEGFKRLESRIAASDRSQDEIKSELRTEIVEQEKRIRALENWRWYLLGGSAAAVFIVEWGARLLHL